jgi:hypothetical protein
MTSPSARSNPSFPQPQSIPANVSAAAPSTPTTPAPAEPRALVPSIAGLLLLGWPDALTHRNGDAQR